MQDQAARHTFAWTAPRSGGLGSITLRRRPTDRLTSTAFWNALGDRINRLIAAEDESEAWLILEPVWANDQLAIERHLASAGSVMAKWSEWLRTKVQFPSEGVPADQWAHEPDTLDHLLSGDDRLEEYIGILYHEPDWA